MKLELNDLLIYAHLVLTESLMTANQILKTDYSKPEMLFDLKGRAAGMAYPYEWKIRINQSMMQMNGIEFINQVIPHELAHLLVHKYYRIQHGIEHIRPHGIEWAYIMEDIFKLPADRTHRFKVPKQRKKVFSYKCQCMEYFLSTIRHNRVMANTRAYSCGKCKQKLAFTGEIIIQER